MGIVAITMILCEFNLPGDAMKSACGWSSGFRKDPMSMDGAGVGSGCWEQDIAARWCPNVASLDDTNDKSVYTDTYHTDTYKLRMYIQFN